jgi:hypothetical protein
LVSSVDTNLSHELTLVWIVEAALAQSAYRATPVDDCLLQTNKENIMKMRIAIFAVCAGTLALAANLAQAEEIRGRKQGDADTLAAGKKASTKTDGINATSPGAGSTQRPISDQASGGSKKKN